MKVLDWGEDGVATPAEAAALRASFRQEVAVWHKLDHPNVTKVRTHSIQSYLFKLMTTTWYLTKLKKEVIVTDSTLLLQILF